MVSSLEYYSSCRKGEIRSEGSTPDMKMILETVATIDREVISACTMGTCGYGGTYVEVDARK